MKTCTSHLEQSSRGEGVQAGRRRNKQIYRHERGLEGTEGGSQAGECGQAIPGPLGTGQGNRIEQEFGPRRDYTRCVKSPRFSGDENREGCRHSESWQCGSTSLAR